MIHQAGGTVPPSNVFLSETGLSTAETCGVHSRPVSFHSVYLTASVYLSISVYGCVDSRGVHPGLSHSPVSTCLPLPTRGSCFGGCSLTDALPTRICTTLILVSSKALSFENCMVFLTSIELFMNFCTIASVLGPFFSFKKKRRRKKSFVGLITFPMTKVRLIKGKISQEGLKRKEERKKDSQGSSSSVLVTLFDF